MAVSDHRRKVAGGAAANRGGKKIAARIEGQEQGKDRGGVRKRQKKLSQVPLVKTEQDKGNKSKRGLADQVQRGAEVQITEGSQ